MSDWLATGYVRQTWDATRQVSGGLLCMSLGSLAEMPSDRLDRTGH